VADVKESGLAYEIRNLELKLNKRHDKAVKDLKARIDELEGIVGKLGAWVASKQRAEAQEKVDDSPVIHKRDESGQPWLRARTCAQCGHVLIMDSGKGYSVCPREGCVWYGAAQ